MLRVITPVIVLLITGSMHACILNRGFAQKKEHMEPQRTKLKKIHDEKCLTEYNINNCNKIWPEIVFIYVL